jgi:hypothetical protein
MTADLTDEELAAYAAGDCAPDAARRIEEELGRDGSVRRRLHAIRRADAALRALPRRGPSAAALLDARRALAAETRTGVAPEVMTLDEVAAFLRVSTDDLAELVEELPAFEVAGRVRVRRARLLDWLERREHSYARNQLASRAARSLAAAGWKGVA